MDTSGALLATGSIPLTDLSLSRVSGVLSLTQFKEALLPSSSCVTFFLPLSLSCLAGLGVLPEHRMILAKGSGLSGYQGWRLPAFCWDSHPPWLQDPLYVMTCVTLDGLGLIDYHPEKMVALTDRMNLDLGTSIYLTYRQAFSEAKKLDLDFAPSLWPSS